MAEIINLRQVRKARARTEAEATAEDNRIAYGRPKKVRTIQQRRKAIEDGRHEGHRLGDRLERESDTGA